MSTDAVIYTYTVIYSTTEAFKDKTPYVAAIVTKDDGQRIAALVEGFREGMNIYIGMPVKLDHLDALGNPIYRFEEAANA